jgi:hypothetical protein
MVNNLTCTSQLYHVNSVFIACTIEFIKEPRGGISLPFPLAFSRLLSGGVTTDLKPRAELESVYASALQVGNPAISNGLSGLLSALGINMNDDILLSVLLNCIL